MSSVTFCEARRQVSSNYRASIQMLPALLEEHCEQWVVLRNQIAIKLLPTEMDAHHYATSEFADERWSIQQIRDQHPIRMGSFSPCACHRRSLRRGPAGRRRSPRYKSYRDPELPTGKVVVPSRAIAREGVAHLYGRVVDEAGMAHSDPDLNAIGRAALESRGIPTADSLHLTCSSIFAQSGAMVEEWREAGYRSVDMEAATLFAVAKHFGFAATALLAVWDQLTADRSFLDPLTPEEEARLDAANKAVFEAALEIAATP